MLINIQGSIEMSPATRHSRLAGAVMGIIFNSETELCFCRGPGPRVMSHVFLSAVSLCQTLLGSDTEPGEARLLTSLFNFLQNLDNLMRSHSYNIPTSLVYRLAFIGRDNSVTTPLDVGNVECFVFRAIEDSIFLLRRVSLIRVEGVLSLLVQGSLQRLSRPMRSLY